MADQLMLDPSTLLGEEGFRWLEDERDLRRFVIPRLFFDQLRGDAPYTDLDVSTFGPLPQGDDRLRLASYVEAFTLFDSDDHLDGSDLREEALASALAVAEQLRELGSPLAAEEWLYLASHSWLALRRDQILSLFKKAGAPPLALKGGLEKLVAGTLQLPETTPGLLTPRFLSKAGIKLVAVGGPALVPWLFPHISAAVVALLTLGSGLYLLFSGGSPKDRRAVERLAPTDIPKVIDELGVLRDKGTITEAEFQSQKAHLLELLSKVS